MPPEYDAFFAAAEKGNLPVMQRTLEGLEEHPPPSGTSLEAMVATFQRLLCVFLVGREVCDGLRSWHYRIHSAGKHLFYRRAHGGTIIPALQNSEGSGDPCFTLGQGALIDESYRYYLRSMYGGKMYIPMEEDVQKCFQDYTPDALLRFRQKKLQPEDIQHIDRLIAKVVFDKNPGHEFYFEEAWLVEWMYPYLEPHGLILKINQQPLSGLSDDTVTQDHDFWVKQLQPMIGDWLTYDTPVQELASVDGTGAAQT